MPKHIVRRMVADEFDTFDNVVIPHTTFADIDETTLKWHHNLFTARQEAHPFSKLHGVDFLRNIGGYDQDPDMKEEGLTQAGADLKKLVLFSKGDRNRRVGEFLKELDLAEARNTGYPVILSAVSANGSPRPKLETNPHRDYFTFVLPIHKLFLKSDAEIVEELNPTDPASEGINEGDKLVARLDRE